MSTLKTLLSNVVHIDGIQSAVVMSKDGFVIEGNTQEGLDSEAISAVVSTSLGNSERIGLELGLGDISQSLVEYENGIMMISMVGSEAFLAVVSDKNTNLGNVRYQVRKILPELKELL